MKATTDFLPYCEKCPYIDLNVTYPDTIYADGKIKSRADVKVFCTHETLCGWLAKTVKKERDE